MLILKLKTRMDDQTTSVERLSLDAQDTDHLKANCCLITVAGLQHMEYLMVHNLCNVKL